MGERGQNSEKLPLRECSIPEICGVLQNVLGRVLVAYAIAERDPTKIDSLACADVEPTDEVAVRLRDLAEVTEVGLELEGSEDVVRATMIGMNPYFNVSPIEMFHNGEGHQVVVIAGLLFD